MNSLNLLQINATIITGLLILLTVQTFSEEIRPLQDHNEWLNIISKLKVEKFALEKTLESIDNKTASLITIDNKTMFLISIDRVNQLQAMKDELSTRLVEVSYTIDKMEKTKIMIIDENGKVITIEEETNKPSFTKIIQTYGITMLVPFIASSMFLMGTFLEKSEKIISIQKAFVIAKLLTLIGFGIILISLVVFTFMIKFG
ncbi:MAG: hypothetical protein K8Q89_08370 [Nitrosarchaeum sp.]|nr:hypothetical protein [Nitrosarchaeum sp.]